MERGAVSVAVLLITAALLAVASGAGSGPGRPSYAGRTLTEVLELLEAGGLHLVYSTALVRPEMVVAREPRASEPREVLDEVLAPFELRAEEAEGGTLVIVAGARRRELPSAGVVEGSVVTSGDPALLSGVLVSVEGTGRSATVSADGHFEIAGVPAGRHRLATASVAFLPLRVEGLEVRAGKVTEVHLRLVPSSVFLGEVIVTPGHFRILQDLPESRQYLSREDFDRAPHVAPDPYRAIQRLPGATSGDFSAMVNLRGGEASEVRVILDGVELIEPFHLKDFQNVFSIVDSEVVAGIDVLTGAFPAEYGDAMSGVIDIAVTTPVSPAETKIGLGTMTSGVLSEGTFDRGRGRWLASARGWYPTALLDAVGATSEDIQADLFDLFAKLQHQVGEHSTLDADVLAAYDDLGLVKDTELQADATYSSYQAWLSLRTDWTDALFSQTVLSHSRISRERNGDVDQLEEGTATVRDQRSFELVGLEQSWTLRLGDRQLLKWGANLRRQGADYDYARHSVFDDPEVVGAGPPLVRDVAVDLHPSGTSYGAHVADRIRPLESVVVELGLRWDRQSWEGEHQISPRFNLMVLASPQTTLRFGWGRFYQAQRLNELQVEDGVTRFYPAQRSEHWLAGLETNLGADLALRAEAYAKELSRLRPRYESLLDPIQLLPETAWDRVLVAPQRGRERGVELLLEQRGGRRLTWWVSYALSSADDVIEGRMVPRSWDQRHAARLGLNVALPRGWNVNLGGTYRSGWPTTTVSGVVEEGPNGEPVAHAVLGPRNGSRFPAFARLDLRASKTFPTASGAVSLVVDILNLTNRKNVRSVEDFELVVGEDATVTVNVTDGYWAPIVPSLGVQWQF